MEIMAATLGIIILIVLVGLAATGATFYLARTVARQEQALDARLRPREAITGQCAFCEGKGWRFSGRARAAAPETCWRCDGSGLPPPAGVSSVRHQTCE